MLNIDGLLCTWDFKDQLVAVEDDTMRAEYRYDYTGRRIIKKVFWKHGEPLAPGRLAPSKLRSSTTSVRAHDESTNYVFRHRL